MKGIDIVSRKSGRSLTYFLFPDDAAARAWCVSYGIALTTVLFYVKD